MKNAVFIFGLFAFLSLSSIEIPFNKSDFTDLPQGRSRTKVFVTNSQGEIVEAEATIDTATGVLLLPTIQDTRAASVFVPELGERYLWDNGHWVNRQGAYYVNGVQNTLPYDSWSSRWNSYWSNEWPGHWHRYYDRHHNDPGFHYGDHRDWKNHWHDKRKYKHSEERRHHRREHRRDHSGRHHDHKDKPHHKKEEHHHKKEHHHKSHHGGHHKK